MKRSRNWPITPSTSIGLLVLIAVLHVVEDLIQSIIRITKVLAIAILILLRIKASRSGAKYIHKGLSLVLAANHPLGDSNARSQGSAELSLWLALARRVRDMAYNAFSRIPDSSDGKLVEANSNQPQQDGTLDTPTHEMPIDSEIRRY